MDGFTNDLNRYRPLLHLRIRQAELSLRLQPRFDSSDIVQDTFCKAYAALGEFRGTTEAQLIAWLQVILENEIIDYCRKNLNPARDVRREQSIRDAMSQSSVTLAGFLSASQPSPSEVAERREDLLRIAEALEQLPEDQRDAVIAKYLLGLTLTQTAKRLGKTESAVAGLLGRGRKRLREFLPV